MAFLRYQLCSIAPKLQQIQAEAETTHPMILPTVQVKPYMANASVEFVSSVMSPIAALTTATLPFKAPDILRMQIIIQNDVDRPLDVVSA